MLEAAPTPLTWQACSSFTGDGGRHRAELLHLLLCAALRCMSMYAMLCLRVVGDGRAHGRGQLMRRRLYTIPSVCPVAVVSPL
jgi:hypothetical protein